MCFCSVFSFPISRNAAESRANQETEGYVRIARVAVVDRIGEETGPLSGRHVLRTSRIHWRTDTEPLRPGGDL